MIAYQKKFNKRQREKLEKVGHTFGRVAWTMDDFYRNLKLCNVGIDIRSDINLDLVTNVELEEVFGKKGHNGQKPKLNNKLTIANYAALLKFLMPTPLTMGQCVVFSNIFTRLISPMQRAQS